MTFEEFFIKKKIDLKALKAADEPLFEEFRAHYSAMGEKSFDHSKKFWFNKLRKSYHLSEEETSLAKPTVKHAVINTQSDTSTAETAKPAGFKPRFKAATTPAVNEGETTFKSEAADSAKTESDSAPTGFKPRFKAGVTKTPDATANTATEGETTDETAASAPKPTGFKPRFKAGVTKTETSEQVPQPEPTEHISPAATGNSESENNNTQPQEQVANKPTGFKPRFKAGVTKTETSEQVPQPEPTEHISSEATGNSEPENNHTQTQEQVANKPTGFKPRFKAGVTKTPDATANTATERETTDETAASANTATERETTDETAASAPRPTGFKPRFKAGVTKTENSEQVPQPEPTEHISPEATGNSEPDNNNTQTQEQVANKPTGFKPRFKAGVTKIDKKEE